MPTPKFKVGGQLRRGLRVTLDVPKSPQCGSSKSRHQQVDGHAVPANLLSMNPIWILPQLVTGRSGIESTERRVPTRLLFRQPCLTRLNVLIFNIHVNGLTVFFLQIQSHHGEDKPWGTEESRFGQEIRVQSRRTARWTDAVGLDAFAITASRARRVTQGWKGGAIPSLIRTP
jgi:hypothetical protein